MSFLPIADTSSCVVQVLGFSNLALRDPWPTLERSLQAYTPSYSLILRYGLAATLWLCIGLLQVQLPLFTLYLLPSLLFDLSPLPVFFEKRVKILSSFEISFKSSLFIPTGDLLHCVSRALCGGQNPSVCRSLLHQ